MIDIPGLPEPDAGPVFDLALLVHIAAGVTAVLAGLVAMLARKGGRWHVGAGRVFLGGIAARLRLRGDGDALRRVPDDVVPERHV